MHPRHVRLHGHQRLRLLPGPHHLPRRQRHLPANRAGAPRGRGGRGRGQAQGEGRHQALPQLPQAGVPRRPRRHDHKHHAAQPDGESRRRQAAHDGRERHGPQGPDPDRRCCGALAAALAVLVRPHDRGAPGHRRARELAVGQGERRARVRGRAEDRDASAGEPGVRRGQGARRRPSGPGRGQGLPRRPRCHLSGYSVLAAGVQAVGDVRDARRLGLRGAGGRVGRPPRVRRHGLATAAGQGHLPPGRPCRRLVAGQWPQQLPRLPGEPDARAHHRQSRRGAAGGEGHRHSPVPGGAGAVGDVRATGVRLHQRRRLLHGVPCGGVPAPHPGIRLVHQQPGGRAPLLLHVGSAHPGPLLLQLRLQRRALQGAGVRRRLATAPGPQPARLLRPRRQAGRAPPLRQGVLRLPRQGGGLGRLRRHLLPELHRRRAARALRRDRRARADGAAQVRRRPALGQEPQLRLRRRHRQVPEGQRVPEGEGQVRLRRDLLERVERPGARHQREPEHRRKGLRHRRALRLLRRLALRAGAGLLLPAGEGVHRGEGLLVPSCCRRRSAVTSG